ncbi:polysaccharide pyruvyl transferase [Ruminiclostridium sufflavum DSM 19573]|uniref:Polysaccharide pyruvyl transferase n=1 Tax=Ruminiclostridium sufflavum DSM 19573 TaxID=1121337 RepID=A0A318XQ89_9FIRM|nr:polysaccharide pyruvyl transferase family protein [Ruminiclostridium sufflavum]PYG89490.1 polysaccharide pyruvyl transferase [Ruminiclostridium sufflavum DSM 19573]
MIKIGILTFHRSINYGSFLQSYSLAATLKKHTDFEIEIIDYNMTTVELVNIIPRPFTQAVNEMVRYFRFRRAVYTELPVSKDKLISNKISKANQFIKNKYDAVIVGSDEVWKINRLRGFPNIYWLREELNCIKLSYAASANRTHFDKLDCVQKQYIKDSLKNFSYIGVRDQNTLNNLKKIDKKLVIKRNCDPAFLFDLEMTKNIRAALEIKLKKKYKLELNKPIMGIMCSNDTICRRIYDEYKNRFQIVSLYANVKYAHTYLYDLSPLEWAHVFSFIKLSITNFFHCSVFSIINNTPFISIDAEDSSVLYESKIKDLMRRAGLIEKYFNFKDKSFTWERVFYQIENCIKAPVDNRMELFAASEKKYFYQFVSELNGLFDNKLTVDI